MKNEFSKIVKENLEISQTLKKEPWRINEISRDPKIIAALIAYHADPNLNNYMGGSYESSVREALRCIFESELSQRTEKSNSKLTTAGILVSLAGFALAAVQLYLSFHK